MITIPSLVGAPSTVGLSVSASVARAKVAAGGGGVAPTPILSVTGALSFIAGAVAGTLVALIGNVPAGATPTLTPNDGRLVIAGDAVNGWKAVVGLTASSIGSIPLAVSANGATSASAAVSVTAPIYLPVLPNQYGAFLTKRLYAGYNGRMFTLQRASDNALRDVFPATGSDLADNEAVKTWANGSRVYVKTFYDQFGSSLILTWTDTVNMPVYDPSQSLAGAIPSLYDSIGGIGVSKFLRADVVLDRSALTIFDVVQPLSSQENSTMWAMYNSGLKATMRVDRAVPGLRFTGDANGHNYGTLAIPRVNPSVIGFSSSLTSTKLYIREQEIVGTGTEAQAINLLAVGGDQGTNATNASQARWGYVIYSAQLSTADALAVRDALTQAFYIPTVFDSRVVFTGDSITLGSGSRDLLNRIRQMRLNAKAEMFNCGIGGMTLSTMNTRYAAFISPLYTSAYGSRRCVVDSQAGSNDFAAGATSATMQARNITFTNSAKADGYVMGWGTIIQRVESGLPSGFPTEVASYNLWLNTKANGADFVIDYASQPRFAASDATTTASGLYGDEANGTAGAFIHPSTLGYSLLAPIDAAQLNMVLA